MRGLQNKSQDVHYFYNANKPQSNDNIMLAINIDLDMIFLNLWRSKSVLVTIVEGIDWHFTFNITCFCESNIKQNIIYWWWKTKPLIRAANENINAYKKISIDHSFSWIILQHWRLEKPYMIYDYKNKVCKNTFFFKTCGLDIKSELVNSSYGIINLKSLDIYVEDCGKHDVSNHFCSHISLNSFI